MSLEIAEKLLNGEGLNQSSYMRGLGLNSKDPKKRKDIKKEYEDILDAYSDVIEKQGHDYFMKKSEKVKEVAPEQPEAPTVDESEKLRAEVRAEVKREIEAELKGEDSSPPTWRYRKDCKKGKIFKMSQIEELEKEGWVDHPDKV